MKAFFGGITSLALRFWLVTIAISILIAGLGFFAVTQLQLELIPSIEFPQTIILAQVSGMDSEEVLNVVTIPLETELSTIDDIVNVETTTTGAFGGIVVARNEFGIDQARLRQEVQQVIDDMWLPTRRIAPANGEDPTQFAANLLGDLTPDVLIYLHQNNPNFLMQLSPDVWNALSDETLETTLAYLASQTQATAESQNPLRRTIDLSIIPQLESLDVVADVSVSGGQALPGENNGEVAPTAATETDVQMTSLLLELPDEVWDVVAARVEGLGEQNDAAVEQLSAIEFTIPVDAPSLPASWQMDSFADATDLLEMATLTRPLVAVFNDFVESGEIVGSLGQTNDLTPEIVTHMLEVAPSMVSHFEAEHLAAMPADVFAVLPADFIAGLDGFARDELAAAAIASSITGQVAEPVPVDLPNAWQISRPQIITFSFDDLPLASFSVSGTGTVTSVEDSTTDDTGSDTSESTDNSTSTDNSGDTVTNANVPEGPALPQLFTLMGEQMGIELNTADDLISIELPESLAGAMGGGSLRAADFFNFLTLLSDPAALEGVAGEGGAAGFDMQNTDVAAFLPALQECGIGAVAIATGNVNLAEGLIGCVSADAIAFLVENDPTFAGSLQPEVFDYFSDEVLLVEGIAPPLPGEWDTLAQQPQFAANPLRTLADLIELGNGQASTVLNTINATVPEQFAGYEVRLFSSLLPTHLRYLTLHEPDFFVNLDEAVLLKFSPTILDNIPDDVLEQLDDELAADISAIASGEQASALDALSSLYASDVAPADPNAPILNEEWSRIGNFYGIELDTADDLFRFPADFRYSTAAELMNSMFDSPQGAAFAPDLFGGMSVEAVDYMLERDAAVFDNLIALALREFSDDTLARLSQPLQERAASGGEPFVPTDVVTRTNQQSSLQLTVFKTSGANAVSAFHEVDDLLTSIDEANDDIEINVVFEQASFIEESIDGVAREGGLGGVFAIVMILIFLSGGAWADSARRTAGIVSIVVALVLLGIFTVLNRDAAEGDLVRAFTQMNIVIQVPLVLLLVAGLLFFLFPGKLPYPAWRSTLVTAVSIPLSVLIAFALMRWLPSTVHGWLLPYADSSVIRFILRLFPESITLNIMTLSGLTVAIGRVVDDSIVVLENIFRELQAEEVDKRTAIITGTRDVSVAIFAATVITVVVFIPLGLTGGIIGEFFLPFGLAVTYSLMASFLVAITVVPVLVYLVVRREDIHHEEGEGQLERMYLPMLRWALKNNTNRVIVLVVAIATMIFGLVLFSSRPAAFLPDFGEPQIAITVSMPAGTPILETNALVTQMEAHIAENFNPEEIEAVETVVGGGGLSMEALIGLGGSVAENEAEITIGLESQEELDAITQQLRTEAERIFGTDNVTVSSASISAQGFGAFSLVVSGPREDLQAIDATVVETLEAVEGLSNINSSLSQLGDAGAEGPVTYLRIDGQTAVTYTGELESEDSLNVIQAGKEAVLAIPNLPDTIHVSEGFETEIQTEGFASMFVAMGIAVVIVIVILIFTFGSIVHWLDLMLSVVVAPVGAAIALTLTDRVLGISALIGMLMLVGIVVTNAVVLIDRVMANQRERHMTVHDALIEAGSRRLRPILMTAFATIFALLPLAVGLSGGAIIASELGTVVIGGLFSSTLLALIVVPVAYSLLHPIHQRLANIVKRSASR